MDRGANYGSHIPEGYRFVTFGQDMSVRRVKGFTIFELLITVAIVALISAFAIPAFQDIRVRGRITASAEQFSSSMQMARNTAIVRRRMVLMQPASTTDHNNWTLRMDVATTGPMLSTIAVAPPVVVTSWAGANTADVPTQVAFRQAGQVEKTSTAGTAAVALTFRVCDSSVATETGRDVIVSPVGRIVISQHNDKSVCNP